MQHFILGLLLVIFSPAGLAGEPPLAPDSPSAKSSGRTSPKDLHTLVTDIEKFVSDARLVMPDDSEVVPVEERLLSGFQQEPPRQLQLENGVSIYWGWQEGQAFVQSIAIYDEDGAIRLVGAVDDVPRLYSWRSNSGVVDDAGYRELLRKYAKWGSAPSVVLFTQEASHLNSYLPLVQRWLQAAMMGFNTDCSDPKRAPTCVFAETVSVPTVAYTLNCENGRTVSRCPVQLPTVQPLPVPLKVFTQ